MATTHDDLRSIETNPTLSDEEKAIIGVVQMFTGYAELFDLTDRTLSDRLTADHLMEFAKVTYKGALLNDGGTQGPLMCQRMIRRGFRQETVDKESEARDDFTKMTAILSMMFATFAGFSRGQAKEEMIMQCADFAARLRVNLFGDLSNCPPSVRPSVEALLHHLNRLRGNAHG